MDGHSGVASWLVGNALGIMPPPIRAVPEGMMNLAADHRPVHTIDPCDRIVSVNSAWVEFMRENGCTNLTIDTALGRSIWDFVRGLQVRQLWEVLFERVRAVGAPVFVPMRADKPDLRRVLDIELHPLPERSIRQVFECVWTEARPRVALLDPAHPRNADSLPHCAWCNRLQVRIGAWEEIEDAALTLRLQAAEALPVLKSSVCSSCKQSLLKTFPARVM
jgi:hypothetical protein